MSELIKAVGQLAKSMKLKGIKDTRYQTIEEIRERLDGLNIETSLLDIIDFNSILNKLAQLVSQEDLTLIISNHFRPILIELVYRSIEYHLRNEVFSRIESLSLMFSKLLPSTPQLKLIFIDFIKTTPSLMDLYSSLSIETIEAYLNQQSNREGVIKNLNLAFKLLLSFKELDNYWNLNFIYLFVQAKDVEVAGLALRCIQLFSGLTENDAKKLVSPEAYLKAQLITLNLLDEYNDNKIIQETDQTSWDMKPIQPFLSKKVVVIGNVLIYKTNIKVPKSPDLVNTKTTEKNLQEIALALSMGAPVLLEGGTGVGKTALIEEVARAVGKDDLVKIHLGDQTDSKALLGTYVATSTPGQFRWQMGVLTKAVKYGSWVLIEDIDLAPQEVISVIVPLLESRTLFISNRGERLVAADGFQLFATRRVIASKHNNSFQDKQLPGGSLWTKVTVNPLEKAELNEVIAKRFPQLAPLSSQIIDVFEVMESVYLHPEQLDIPSSRIGRPLTTRDLIKWCIRMANLIKGSTKPIQLPLNDKSKEDFFSEAADTFCGMLTDYEVWGKVLSVLGEAMEIHPQRAQHYAKAYVPSINMDDETCLQVGRVTLAKLNLADGPQLSNKAKVQTFALTKHALRLLEKLAVSVHLNEPVLLVGETGTGKTTVVQHLAKQMNQKLLALNLSQQSDSSDLLGGFKPVDAKALAIPIYETFEELFKATFSTSSNTKFLSVARKFFNKKKWSKLIQIFTSSISEVSKLKGYSDHGPNAKSPRKLSSELEVKWIKFEKEVKDFEAQADKINNKLMFSFLEGSLVKAVRKGHWVLLDEINLASTETLECLSGLLQDSKGSILLTEKGDTEVIERHPNFRVFACMNPATDVGKRDLPPGLRNRFTEFYVHSPDTLQEDLISIVQNYLHGLTYGDESSVMDVVEFYRAAKDLQSKRLIADGANQIPHYSIRTLSRSLSYVAHIVNTYGLRRSLFEGFSMTFSTQLNKEGEKLMMSLIKSHLLRPIKNIQQLIAHTPKLSSNEEFDNFIQFGPFWLPKGEDSIDPDAGNRYIITPSVKENLHNLCRVVMSSKYPVLIQGPTSSGKTSMVEYLAKCTGHKFVRINNHEHTDLQEYIGSYISKDGKLVFEEGALVKALRSGHWIVLDELNLAPSDVLEALNRLLDDNRELLISETQEIVKPHPHFMLFATQNPAGLYGGRKALSRAFRNRFLELHFDDIPEEELETILGRRCVIAPSYCKKLIQVYKTLQERRQSTRVFESKEGFITLRDLFRWANRQAVGYEELASHGYMLLAERVRKPEEKLVVKEAIEQVMKVKIVEEDVYNCDNLEEYKAYLNGNNQLGTIAWTSAMKRLFSLVATCLRHKEPILLVGETGCGKTTVCQMLACALRQKLHILNCHQNTETSDLLGGQRPLRNKATFQAKLLVDLRALLESYQLISIDLLEGMELEMMTDAYEAMYNYGIKSPLFKLVEEGKLTTDQIEEMLQRCYESRSLFEWHDGPLVQSMKEGNLFLLDEISLAEDSVLERLNSVLEPQRLLVLAEKGAEQVEELIAHENFQFFATMNPGGDFGKKELSPALRNRFTEIWVPPVTNKNDLSCIIEERLTSISSSDRSLISKCMLAFLDWFDSVVSPSKAASTSQIFSLRDILSWASFVNDSFQSLGGTEMAVIHGGCLVFLDGLGSNSSMVSVAIEDPKAIQALRFKCLLKLISLTGLKGLNLQDFYQVENTSLEDSLAYSSQQMRYDELSFGIGNFKVTKGTDPIKEVKFSVSAPTTFDNMRRVLRALQIPKPIMLEGSPGVGKTSLIQALSDLSGHPLVRINLSEQTDLMDLFGTDLPVEGGKSGEFAWRDAPFLQAMRMGWWVLLDEINLASQSVLEGLNSCLDHRGSVFIPELDRTFDKSKNFRVFAAQNPLQQGGGRKGLPKSFINRFTQVYVEPLQAHDLRLICKDAYPGIDSEVVEKMLKFNFKLHEETMVKRSFARQGNPWEFNLRDIFRWMDLLVSSPKADLDNTQSIEPSDYLDLVYLQRMRTLEDRQHVLDLYSSIFVDKPKLPLVRLPEYHYTSEYLHIGRSKLDRKGSEVDVSVVNNSQMLQSQLGPMESVMKCIEMNWMAILIGSNGCGKTSMIRFLSQILGHKLVEFSMNPGVDTMELLGGFEQMEPARYRQMLKDQLISCLSSATIHLGSQIKEYDPIRSGKLGQCLAKVSELSSALKRMEWDIIGVGLIQQFVERVTSAITEFYTLFPTASLLCGIEDIKRSFSALYKIESESTGGRFEWVEGVLIEAMEKGHWFLIDNANLCHASVLDRLNPLLEPNGSLMLHERGLDSNGQVRWARPHPNFRIFLAMNPDHGELSRPMRNRGIEIAMPSSKDWSINPFDMWYIATEHHPFTQAQVESLIRAHHGLLSQFDHLDQPELVPGRARDFSFFCGWVAERIQRGIPFQTALEISTNTVYKFHLDDDSMSDPLSLPDHIFQPSPKILIGIDSQLSTVLKGAEPFRHFLSHATNLDDKDLFYIIEAISQHFSRGMTLNDGKLRQMVMEWLKSKTTSPNKFGLQLAQFTMSAIESSGLLERLINSYQNLYPYSSFYLTSSISTPADIENNIDAMATLTTQLRLTPTGPLSQTWSQFQESLGKYDTFVDYCQIQFDESNFVKAVDKKMSNYNLLEQSYLASRHGTTPEGRYGELIKLFYPFLVSIKCLVEQWFQSMETEGDKFGENKKAISNLISHLKLLTNTLSSGQVELARIMFITKWIKKTLLLFPTHLIQNTISQIDLILGQVGNDSHHAMKLIWKYLKYPTLPNLQLYEIRAGWVDKFDAIDLYTTNQVDEFGFNPYIGRKEGQFGSVLKALATLFILEPSSESIDQSLESIELIVKQSYDQLKLVSEQQVQTVMHDKVRDFTTQLIAILDHESLAKESSLISELLSSATFNNVLGTDFSDKVNQWLEFSFANTSRGPMDFLAMQNVIWGVERDSSDFSTLRSFGLTQLLSWYSRSWKISYNYILPAKSGLDNDTHSDLGPVRLYQAIKTYSMVSVITSLSQFPLKFLNQNTDRIKNLSDVMFAKLEDEPIVEQGSLRLINATLAQIVRFVDKYVSTKEMSELMCSFKLIDLGLSQLNTNIMLLGQESYKDSIGFDVIVKHLNYIYKVVSGLDIPIYGDALSQYICPAIELFANGIQELKLRKFRLVSKCLGKVWVLLGLGFISIYVPKFPYDPVMKAQMKFDVHSKEEIRAKAHLVAHKSIQQNINGSTTNNSIHKLETKLVDIGQNLNVLEKSIVLRPDQSQLNGLFRDIEYLTTKLVDYDTINKLVSDLSDSVENSRYRESMLQDTIQEFLRRLRHKFGLYGDIIKPIELALHQIKHGLRVYSLGCKEDNKGLDEAMEKVVWSVLAYPDPNHRGEGSVMDHLFGSDVLAKVKHQFTTNPSSTKTKIYGDLLVLMGKRFVLEIGSKGWISQKDQVHFEAMFKECSQLWTLVDDSLRKAQLEAEQQFKKKVQVEDNFEDTDEELLTREMEKMFPTFESEFSEAGKSDEVNNSSEVKYDEMDVNWIREMVGLHRVVSEWLTLAQTKTINIPHSEREALHLESYQLASKLINQLTTLPNPYLDSKLKASHALASYLGWKLSVQAELSTASRQTLTRTIPYNFYNSPNVGQAQKIVTILERFILRCKELLEQWPEHAVLQELIDNAGYVLNLSCQSPIMKLLTGLEVLLNKAQDWETYASKQVSLSANLSEITGLAISWRQLELGSWPTLLDSLKDGFVTSANKWWLNLHNTILSFQSRDEEEGSDEAYLDTTINTIDQFLRSSNLGEFETRLQMVGSLMKHLEFRLNYNRFNDVEVQLLKVLKNLHVFYDQFIQPTRDRVMGYRKPIEKQLKELVKIASWKDVNVDMLKQSANKTHRALAKLTRKFRGHLIEPISLILDQVQASVLESGFKFDKAVKGEEKSVGFNSLQIEHGLSRVFLNTDHELYSVYAKMGKLYKSDIFATHRHISPSPIVLEEFLSEVLEQIKQFQNETIPADEDERKAYIKTRRMIKKKSLNDFWKQLKAMGLRYRSSVKMAFKDGQLFKQPGFELFDVNWAYSHGLVDKVHGSRYLENLDWSKAKFYTQRLFARLAHLKNCAMKPSPDAAGPEIEKGLGYVDSLTLLVNDQRSVLGNVNSAFLKLQAMLAVWLNIGEGKGVGLDSGVVSRLEMDKELLDSVVVGLHQVERMVDHRIEINMKYNERGQFLKTQLKELLNQLLPLQVKVNDQFSKVVMYPQTYGISPLPDHSLIEFNYSVYTHLAQLYPLVDDMFKTSPDMSTLLSPIVNQLTAYLKARVDPNQFPLAKLKDESFIKQQKAYLDLKVKECIERIQISMQILVKQSRSARSVEHDQLGMFGMRPNQLTTDHNSYTQSFDALALNDVVIRLEELHLAVYKLATLSFSNKSEVEKEIYSIMEPVIAVANQHFLMARQLIWEFLAFHKSVTKLGYVVCNLAITLFTQGLCLPQIDEKDAEQGPDQGNQTGTGIGEGQGDKDVGDEIDNEDQVTGTQNEKKEDTEDQGESEKEKAFEMEQDFDGEMEDVDKESEEELGSEEESEEEEDNEDQMGEVEGENEEVDDKIWGDDGPEEEGKEPEKESNQQADGGEDEDIVAKDEDDDKPSEKTKPEEEEQTGEDGQQPPPVDEDEGGEENEFEEKDDENDDPENDQTKPVDVPEGENLDLPDDLELDMDDEDKNEEGFKSDEDVNEEEMGDMDQKEEDEPMEDEEEMGEDNPFDIDQPQTKAPEEDENQMGDEEDNQEDNDKVQLDPEEREDAKDDEDKMDDPTQLEEDAHQSHQNQQLPPTQNPGVRGEKGDMALQADGKPDENEEDNNDDGEMDQSAGNKNQKAKQDKNDQKDKEDGDDKEEGEQDGEDQVKDQTNPHRILADALDKWKQRLEVKDQAQEEEELNGEDNKEDKNPLPIDDMADKQFEYVEEDQEGHDAETLGVANEEQFKQSMSIPIQPETGGEDENGMEPQVPEPTAVSQRAVEGEIETNQTSNIPGSYVQQPTEFSNETMPVDGYEPTSQRTIDQLRDDMEDQLSGWRNSFGTELQIKSQQLWHGYEAMTHELALNLAEQLRLILEPTLATKLRGDYRTGKRLNMKKIIPYIASQFKKDKIWLRRTKPSQRQYQVMLAVDDSKSMAESKSVQLTFESLALVTRALTQLEVGSTSVVSFGDQVQLLHPFDMPLTPETGSSILSNFTFQQTRTDLSQLLQTSLSLFDQARHNHSASTDLWQLQLILSDGLCDDHDQLKAYLRMAHEQRVMVIFLVMDTKPNPKDSILNVQNVSYQTDQDGKLKLQMKKYIDSFPFQYYVILKDVQALPHVLSDALRQYFSLVKE